ncbi:sterol desaturase family protein [Winogradskyella sp.]|uniref:sterol desaturase family protein n=1 Tax=Winogradskyella sp. TaxID=1883156 RepID=UPI0025DD43C5|nr:sterol desaturase family protein [Winogradskyella sp.]
METIINYFETIPPHHRGIIIVSGITFFWLLEGAMPLFKFDYKKWKHAIPNLFFTLTTIIVNLGLAWIFLIAADWTKANDFGIINWLPQMPLWLYALIGVVLLDFFGAYFAHYVEHKVKPLWMVHLVHHTDHMVDTTTANRHHPIESIIRFSFTLLGILVVGTPIALVMMYQAMSLIFTQFTHANLKISKGLDKVLSYVIVSPDMHKIHHHYRLPYTDSNYGNILSIWDHIFGTYMYMERENLIYGVDVFPDEKKNSNIKDLLKQPFQKYEKPTLSTDAKE